MQGFIRLKHVLIYLGSRHRLNSTEQVFFIELPWKSYDCHAFVALFDAVSKIVLRSRLIMVPSAGCRIREHQFLNISLTH